jgi:hypothetical protein
MSETIRMLHPHSSLVDVLTEDADPGDQPLC